MSQMPIPIIFIHQGNSFYLPFSLVQVTQTNPGNPVYLLGNKANGMYSNLVYHKLISNYFNKAKAFAPLYQHHSTNPHDYELFCIQRWFVLLEFMEMENLDSCLYLDSDILYYSHADDEYNALKQLTRAGMTSVTKSPHTNYVSSRKALQEFCDYITDCYATEAGKEKLMAYLAEHEGIHGKLGGISDMTFFLHYRRENPELVYDLSQVKTIGTDTFCYDITIDTVADYLADGRGLKKVEFRSSPQGVQQPLAQNQDGRKVRLVTLHFQGASKQYMHEFVKAVPANYGQLLKRYKFQDFLGRVMRKLKLAS